MTLHQNFILRIIWFTLAIFASGGLAKNSFAATYYIDFNNGSNSNPGTKELPWKSHPRMQALAGCTGNGSLPSYSHAEGDHFIFKGGEVWPKECWPMINADNGNSSAYDYYGTKDDNGDWGSGKAVFDGGGIVGGSLLDPAADWYNYGPMMRLSGSYKTIDNVEFRNLGGKLAGDGVSTSPLSSLVYADTPRHVRFTRVLGHNFAPAPGATTDGIHCFLWQGAGEDVSFDNGEVHNTEFTGSGLEGCAFNAIHTLTNSTIHDVSIGNVGSVIVHDNTFYNINYPVQSIGEISYSRNLIWTSGDASDFVYVYNNVFYGMNPTTTPIFVRPCWSSPSSEDKQFIFNNVLIAANGMSTGFMDVGPGVEGIPPQQNPDYCGHLYLFNNTYQTDSNNYWIRISGRVSQWDGHLKHVNSVTILNMHVINEQGIDNGCDANSCWRPQDCPPGSQGACVAYYVAPQTMNFDAANPSASGVIFQSNANAIAQGYTAANRAVPQSASGVTVDSGIDITTQGWYSSLPQEIKTAIGKDKLGHSRGQGSGWDIGAYEYVPGGDTTPPAAPRGLRIQ